MKNSYLILFCLLFSLSIKSQTIRVDYDNSSNWFMGLNVGGTWNTTDVRNKTSVGWGLILGKSYGFKSYNPFTFDIRARYLRGFWYGQDYDTSSLAGYSGTALSGYSSQGLTVHNFQNDVHRLGLELAIHLNSVTARTGWDPYVFGGIGFTWHQAFGDLQNQNDSSAVYDYSSMLSSGSLEDQISNNLDEIYDTPLDGYIKSKYNVSFMPSLGFGLGYHIGKRTTLGIEHKTTFTLRDDFDGLNSNVRTKNDLYHYTSLYLRFRFRGKRPNENVSNVPCIAPIITLINPSQNQTVSNPQYMIQATVTEVQSLNQISVTSPTGVNIPFDYNFSTKALTANVLLIPGNNSYTIRVSNKCGSDSKVANLNFMNCSLPTAVFTNPINSGTTVRNNAFTLTASINGVSNVQGIKLFQNGMAVNGFSFNTNNGLLQASVNLIPGENNFVIELFNACGSNSFSTSLNYDNCINPTISLVSPSSTGSTVNNATLTISSIITSVTDKNQINISKNNIAERNFIFSNGRMDLTTNLTPGLNTFVILVNNSCGSASETFTVNYQTCNAPIINLEYPTVTGTILTNSSLTLKAKVYNVDSKQNIVVSINGLAQKNFTFNKSSNFIETPISIQSSGNNVITITAINECGADVETSTVVYNPCSVPVIGLSNMLNTVNNSAYNFSATISNQLSTDGISLTLNGNPINYSFSNNSISSSVNLQSGLNTFVLNAVNSCGRDSKTWTVTNNNCIVPSISLEYPTATGITLNNNTIQFKATINGISNNQGIVLTINNIPVSVNYQNGVITNTLNLVPGSNTIKLTVQNPCGFDSEELIVNYQTCDAPVLTINQPIDNNSTLNQSTIQLNASVTNVNSNQGIAVKLNGIGIAFQYNNNQITSNLNLQPGANTVLISASNSCGTDVQAINLNYDNCVQPQITLSNYATSTSNSQFTFNATLSGTNVSQGITFTQNGIVKTYTLNGTSFSSNLTLVPGVNLISLSAINVCGRDVETLSITYTPCIAPVVSITNPITSNTTFNTGSFTFQGVVNNVNSISDISLTLNGNPITNFTFSNGQLVANIVIGTGANTLKLTANNSCGNDSESIVIIGKACDSPIISLNPNNNSTLTNPVYSLQGNISNIPSSQNITLLLNGNPITNFNFSNGILNASLNLLTGLNTIVVTAFNECGNNSQSISVNYSLPCVPVQVTFLNALPSGSSTSETSISLNAQIENYTPNTNIIVKVNGNVTTNYSNVNGLLTGQLNMPNGTLTIEVTASNNCGSDTETYVLTRCKNATIALNVPSSTAIVTSNPTQGISFSVSNVTNSNQILLTQNGQTISNFNLSNSKVQAMLNLIEGLNTVTLTINNGCNSVSETILITYTKPIIENNSNSDNNSTNNTGNEMITICHIPPGNPNNPQTIEIPVSAWPTHQAHGDVLGACPENNNGNSNGSNSNGNNSNGNSSNNNGNNGNDNPTPQTLTICHKHQGRMGNDETLVITPEEWPEHEAHGDVLGSCSQDNIDNANEQNTDGTNVDNSIDSIDINQNVGNGVDNGSNQNNSEFNGNNNQNTGSGSNPSSNGNNNQNNASGLGGSSNDNNNSGNGSGNNGNGTKSQQNSGNNLNNNTNKPNPNLNKPNQSSGNNNTNKPSSNPNISKPNQSSGNNNTNKPSSNPNVNKPNQSSSNTNNNTNKPNPNVNKPNQSNGNNNTNKPSTNPNVNKPNPENKGSEEKKTETPKIKKG